MPEISICIPTYNRAKYLREAVQSVLDQDFSDFELVVVDDCSSDNTADVIGHFADPRLRYISNDTNLGMVGNWNRCLELALSDVVWILHDDDRMAPGALSHVASVHRAYNIGLLFGNHRYFDAARPTAVPTPLGEEVIQNWEAGIPSIRAVMEGQCSCVTVSIRREVYRALGGFDPAFPYSADEEYWPRIARCYAVASTNRVLIYRRLHSGNYMIDTWRQPDFYPNFAELYRRVAGYLAHAGAADELVSGAINRPYHAILGVIVPTLLRYGETRLGEKFLRVFYRESISRGFSPWRRRALVFTIVSRLPASVAQWLVLAYQRRRPV